MYDPDSSRALLPTTVKGLQFPSRHSEGKMDFKLKARINRSDAKTIQQALDRLAAKCSVRKEGDEFLVEAETEGASAKELNRTLLSALRRVEKRTTLRAEWTSGDKTERHFDDVLKKTTKG
jgi:hypothetical protein